MTSRPLRPTNWYVITGAPCSGKSTVINGLEQRGYRVVHEAARAFIDAELQMGKNIKQIKADILSFERQILNTKLATEATLPDSALIFFDRGVPDSIGYYTLEGLNPEEPLEKSRLTRYKKVFFLERLTFAKDPVRSEDDKIAARLDRLLQESYRLLGYEIVWVPLLPVKDRIDFILDRL